MDRRKTESPGWTGGKDGRPEMDKNRRAEDLKWTLKKDGRPEMDIK